MNTIPECDPCGSFFQRSLTFLDRQRPHVHGIELEKIEGAQRCQMVIVSVADQIEHRKPFVVADDDFTVDQTGSHRKRCYGGNCKGEAIPEVISLARNQVDLSSVFAREDAEPVMLDLVNPVWTGWRLLLPVRGRQGSKENSRRLRRRRSSRNTDMWVFR